MSKLIQLEDSITGEIKQVRVRQRSDEKSFMTLLTFLFDGKRPSVIVVRNESGQEELVPPIPSALFPLVKSGPKHVYLLRFQDDLVASVARAAGKSSTTISAATSTAAATAATTTTTPTAASSSTGHGPLPTLKSLNNDAPASDKGVFSDLKKKLKKLTPRGVESSSQQHHQLSKEHDSGVFEKLGPEWRTMLLSSGIHPDDLNDPSKCREIASAISGSLRAQKTKQTAPSSKLHKQQFDELEAPTDCAPLPPVMEQAPSAEPAEHVSIEDRPLRQSESLDLDALLQQLNLVASDLPSEPESESHRNALADLLDSNLGDDGLSTTFSLGNDEYDMLADTLATISQAWQSNRSIHDAADSHDNEDGDDAAAANHETPADNNNTSNNNTAAAATDNHASTNSSHRCSDGAHHHHHLHHLHHLHHNSKHRSSGGSGSGEHESEEDDSYDESFNDLTVDEGTPTVGRSASSAARALTDDEADDSWDEEHDDEMDELEELSSSDLLERFRAEQESRDSTSATSWSTSSSPLGSTRDPYNACPLQQQIIELCEFLQAAIARGSPKNCDKLRQRLKNKWRPVHQRSMLHEKMRELGVSSPTDVLELALRISALMTQCNEAFAGVLPPDHEFVIAH